MNKKLVARAFPYLIEQSLLLSSRVGWENNCRHDSGERWEETSRNEHNNTSHGVLVVLLRVEEQTSISRRDSLRETD